MFFHAYHNYILHAFPDDEIMPLSCTGRNVYTSNRGSTDEALGDYSLTLIDAADTLVVMGEIEEFKKAVQLIIEYVNFDKNVTVSVFEANIRVLGGLLSSHFFSEIFIHDYKGELLLLAQDIGDRLLKAFNTSTGIPYNKVNLKYGHFEQSNITCTACAGTYLLEFGLLSRLLNDSKYEDAARKSFIAIYNRRSSLNLLGSTIDVNTGIWNDSFATVGAAADSYFEYALKSYILFNDKEYYVIFNTLYTSIVKYLYKFDLYLKMDMNSASKFSVLMDTLSAFWPGIQAIIGDVKISEKNFQSFANIWEKYKGLPELIDILNSATVDHGYYLRPEIIESAYFLYQTTKDEYYFEFGRDMIRTLQTSCRVNCGFASILDVRNGTLDDRMDSYFLSETLKYLYLLFDEDNFVNKGNYVFSTEGHIFPIKSWDYDQYRTKNMTRYVKNYPYPKCNRKDEVNIKKL